VVAARDEPCEGMNYFESAVAEYSARSAEPKTSDFVEPLRVILAPPLTEGEKPGAVWRLIAGGRSALLTSNLTDVPCSRVF
jgi:hypothetical protein